ncbi:protein kinase [Anabaena sp. FACHB-1237]|uniref:serine/threonine-protein kinase n=1 Tax=Anabaena sp. FACHB-1237 TaxID=2692769 RepID=UPI001680B8D7|nr:serine/threonine-protein kinase [Anabaena sp. FACHB-1237]MBD2137284.1 protein kinase [Anabaena sp. FACHB-1237]
MLLNNRYQVIRTLGSGGFGETFLAKDVNMPSERLCVVKQLKPIQNNPQIYQLVQERFQREAAILEALGGASEQIPSLYAYFIDGGQFYLVQEWIEGDTLTGKIEKQGLFTNSAVEELLINILPVLDYVHSKHIIHRDIKPDNIIIRNLDHKPVLIDFGAVRESMGTVVNSQGNATSSIIIGTPGFMPSEQAAGRPVYSSDLYSLGLTAIYLLTGKRPQELDTDSQTAEIVWRHFASNINPNLARVIDQAIAYHPRERFASAREMLNALQQQFVTLPPTSISNTKVADPLPQTVAVSPGNNYQNNYQSVNQNNNNINNNSNKGGMIIPAIIASGLIGASIIVSSVINKSSQNVEPVKSANNEFTSNSSNQANSIKTPSVNTDNNIPSASPSPELQVENQTTINRPSPEEAVINYYSYINQGQYQTSWSLLSPSLQNNQRLHPKGYSSYIDWWGGKVQSVDVNQTSLLEDTGNTAIVSTQLRYVLKNGRIIVSRVSFYLVFNTVNNQWIVTNVK